jgi:hypothetical protein
MNKEEATLVGFKLLVNNRGVVCTETTDTLDEDLDKIFIKQGDNNDVKAIVRGVRKKIATLHYDIEQLLLRD